MRPKLLSLICICVLSLSIPGAAYGQVIPMTGHTGSAAMGHSSGHSDWHRSPAHFDHSLWRTGRWWHGRRGPRLGWWWNVGPNWYWYPVAVYPYPDLYTPPYFAPGYWYWCDFYQNYYPHVATCPSDWQAIEPE
jgi:hypothetical protein